MKKSRSTDRINNSWSIGEKRIRMPPSRAEIRKTELLLEDFNIDVRIPVFQTLYELLQWRTQQINQAIQ